MKAVLRIRNGIRNSMQNGIRNSMQNGIRNVLRDEAGQGVAEYIIILAVVVVAAIVLAIAFHEQLSAVWDSVTSQLGELA